MVGFRFAPTHPTFNNIEINTFDTHRRRGVTALPRSAWEREKTKGKTK